MADDSRRAALMAEGLTEAEANYMISGGTSTEGLNIPPAEPPASQDSYAGDADEVARRRPDQTGAQQPPQGQQAQQPEDDDDPAPAQDSPFYPQWHREKKRRQQLQAERQQLREYVSQVSQENAQYREQWARLNERFNVFREAMSADEQQRQGQQPQQPPAPPNRDQDPFGYMEWQDQQRELQAQRINQLEERLNGAATHIQSREYDQALTEAYVNDAHEFRANTPDFAQAYFWIVNNRDQELAALGYRNPAQRKQMIRDEERGIVERAFEAKRHDPRAPGPSEMIYNLAMARTFGNRPWAQAPQNGATAGGAAPAPAPGARPGGAPSVTQQVENIQRGQAASRSLSSAGGSAMPTAPDISRILSMSDEDYANWRRSMTPAQWSQFNKEVLGKGVAL